MRFFLAGLLAIQLQWVSGLEAEICNEHTLSQGFWRQCDANGLRTRVDSLDDWHCYPGIDFPLRMNKDGDVECMSENFRDCATGPTCESVLKKYIATRLNPLTCGDNHLSMHGITGYEDTDKDDHWCFKGRAVMLEKRGTQECRCPCNAEALKKSGWTETCDAKGMRSRTRAFEWNCFKDWQFPIRLSEHNNPECFSFDHHNCFGGRKCPIVIGAFYKEEKVDPITCGSMVVAQYGVTGYHDPNHWCPRSLKYLTNLPVVEKCTCVRDADHQDKKDADHQDKKDADKYHHDAYKRGADKSRRRSERRGRRDSDDSDDSDDYDAYDAYGAYPYEYFNSKYRR